MLAKIAIIDDEVPILQMYRFKFEAEGFTVVTAEDGERGLKLVGQFQPDLLLLDLRMPGLSGVEVLEKLRTTKVGGSLRVIVLTNISRDEAPPKLRYLNVDRYIVKAHHTPTQVVQIAKDVLDIKPKRS